MAYDIDEKRAAALVLGVDVEADRGTVRRAFVGMSWAHHPDRGGASADYARIRHAYDVLTSRGGPSLAARPVEAAGGPGRSESGVALAAADADVPRPLPVVRPRPGYAATGWERRRVVRAHQRYSEIRRATAVRVIDLTDSTVDVLA